MKKPLDNCQLVALAKFAEQNGKNWKAELRRQWRQAAAPAILHALRNTHGPGWLAGFELEGLSRTSAGD